MKLTIALLFFTVLGGWAVESYSQSTRLTIKMENSSIENILLNIENQSEYRFFYNGKIDVDKKISVSCEDKLVTEVLNEIFEGTNIRYKVMGRQISLSADSSGLNGAQEERNVSGKVTDSSGAPLPGVSVVIKGTTNGIITDSNGNYSLPNVPTDATLVFSFVGMKTVESTVSGKSVINIKMEEEAVGVEEVIVVGYGTQKKVNLTGSVDVVSGERLSNRPATNISGLLTGIAPNMDISLNKLGGEPGSEQTWQLRGIGSISGDDAPLVLVDGVEMNINLVDPEAVESISVLKDASASAIYGSRAAFGVVLVITKKGKVQPMQIQYSNNLSFAVPIYVPSMYDSYTYVTAFNQAAKNAGVTQTFPDEQVERVKGYINGTYQYPYNPDKPPYSVWRGRWDGNANNDWTQKYYKSHTFRQKHNVSLNGGDNKTKYYFNAGFFDEPGSYSWGGDNDGYKRYNIMANVTTEINDWIRFDFSSKYARNVTNVPNGIVGVTRSYLWLNMLAWFPMQPEYNIDGSISHPTQVAMEDGGGKTTENNDLWMNLGIELEPVKGWKTNIKYQYNNRWGFETINLKPAYLQIPNGTVGNVGDSQTGIKESLNKGQYYLFSAFTSYEKTLGRHFFKALVGYEQDVDYNKGIYGSKMQLITEEVPSISTALGDFTVDDWMNHWATQGIFGRLNYNFDEKYLVEFSARYDGSSRFAKGSRWGFFPSVSAGYNLHKENFWIPIQPYINTFKLRASYGSLGNQNVSNYLYLATIPVAYRRDEANYSNPGYIIDSEVPLYASMPKIISDDLTWETVTTLNLGFDASFLTNRMEVAFDWYNRTTTDMIGPSVELPSFLGSSAPKSNNAELSTKGFEISLGWRDKISKDFSYNAKLTLGDSKTKILKYLNQNGSIGTWYEGKTYGDVWGLTTDGIIQTVGEEMPDQSYYYSKWGPGDIKYKDISGPDGVPDGKITPGLQTLDDHGDLSVIGNTSPRYNFSISAGLNWKNFDLNTFWQGVGKRLLYPDRNSEYFYGLVRYNSNSALLRDSYHLDYWRPADETNSLGPNTDAYLAKPYFSTEGYKNLEIQTRYKLNAAYLRLRNIEIGYTIPQNILNKVKIQKARVYFSGENLLTFTKMPKLFEPETTVAAQQGDAMAGGEYVEFGVIYPISQMFSFGVNVTF